MTRIAAVVSFLLGTALLPWVASAQQGLQLQVQPDLIPPQQKGNEQTPSFGLADQIYGTNGVDATLVGHAELRRASGIIKGDYLHYDQLTDELFASGSVRLYHDNNTYIGPELRLRLDDYQGFFVAPDYYLWLNQGRGFADRINFLSRQRSNLIEPIYTTCPPGDYEWYMTADAIELDQGTSEGIGHNTTVYFQGVPILTSPYLTFPLSNERRSGFLPPTFATSSNSGYEFLLPYYWNIAPNRDLTIYNDFFSRRGLQEAGDFRFIEPNWAGDFRLEGIDDRETNSFRYSLLLQQNWQGTGDLAGFSATMNVQRVSDPNYFVDFSRSLAAASTRTLPRDVEASYGDDYFTVTLRELRYQTLQLTDSPIVTPYDKVPEIEFHAAKLDLANFDLQLTSFLTSFETIGVPNEVPSTPGSAPIAGDINGDRFVFNPSIAYPLVGPGWFVTPKVAYNFTAYNLTGTLPGQPSSPTRSVPNVTLDSGLTFERDLDVFGKGLEQTLEPRLFYVWQPYRNQQNLPDFDTALPDLDFSHLFTENVFTGYDRLADENQLTGALTTRFLDQQTGQELLRAAVGARYYITGQNVTVPGIPAGIADLIPLGSLERTLPVQAGQTDFLALVSGQVTPQVSVNSAIDYSPLAGGTQRSDLGIRYTPGENRELGFDYRFLHGQFHQYDFTGQYPLGGNWYGVGRVNYSANDQKLVEGLAGLEYRGCCWVLRFAAQHFVTGATTSTTTFFLQLELNGFSQIGTNPLDALRRNVSGYTPIVTPLPEESPYQHYE